MADGGSFSWCRANCRIACNQNSERQFRGFALHSNGKPRLSLSPATPDQQVTGLPNFQSFVQALFCLASKPEYIPILLAEVKDCLGLRPKTWTEENLEKCWKLDSFLKECLRLNSLAAGMCQITSLLAPAASRSIHVTVTMPRKALVPFTFSDGTTIPVGTIVAAASLATHVDEDVYERGSQFDAFRFSDIRERSVATGEVDASVQGDKASRACMTSVGLSYLSFGGGRHLWYRPITLLHGLTLIRLFDMGQPW